ncbi:MAG: glucosamine-6-phosphate deaminase [Candidatus Kryptonium sp.]|nr:glucosamine-6-phosphate deaminase [Candidatus Kryptonium sp.]MCX7761487.1 glucosamine-6-phosphate deaminase [Candidatus Kryptonium sp.]MDW8109525.1 glucosamine-6-phosphate deaminase [Candidatus Kryptonium sp.]
MLVIVKEDYDAMSKEAAKIVADRIRKKPNLVLGLATGSTPLGLYKELIRMHKEEGLDFSKVVTFNLDEYIGLPPEHDQSYHYFMWENLFKHININPANVHIPQGMFGDLKISPYETDPKVEAYCQWYEEQIKKFGGIDLQILGIGANGHIAFNEPGSSLGSRTRIKTLTEKTRQDNSRFFKSIDEVPKYAITMGIGTIMEAKEVILLASGEGKADAVKAAVEGPVTAMCPASMLQMHRKAIIILDKKAASKLSAEFVYYG